MKDPLNCSTCPSRIDSIFCDLGKDQAERLNRAKISNHYKRGQVLFYEGNQPTGIFCIDEGKVKLFKNGEDGKDIILRVVSKGNILGLRSALTGEEFSATAQAIEESTVCFVDRNFMTGLIKSNPAVGVQIIERMSQDLRDTEKRLTDISNKTVRQRLAQLLLSLRHVYGKQLNGRELLNIQLSRAEIASMVSATPETVIRLISEFKDLGHLHLEGKKIFIEDLHGLIQETGLEH